MSAKYVEQPFPWLRRWCKFMGSFPYFVEQQLEKARVTNAPPDAIYYSADDNVWHTIKDVESTYTLMVLRRMAEGEGNADPGRRKVG